jgi:hypothetical protein
MATYAWDPITGTYVLSDDQSFAVTTDQLDHAPDSTATFTANNATVSGTVEFSVAHVNPSPDGIVGTTDDTLTHDLTGTKQPWTVTDGGAGDLDGVVNAVIKTSWDVGFDAAGQAFLLSASDTAAGTIGTTIFTDTVTAGVTPTIDLTKILGIAGDLPLNQPPDINIANAPPPLNEAYFTND